MQVDSKYAESSPITAPQEIDTEYSSLGVTFSMVDSLACGGNTTHAYASSDLPSGFGSAPNLISTCGGSNSSDISEDLTGGTIRATFSSDVSSACVSVRPDGGTDFAFMHAFDSDSMQVDSTVSSAGVTEQICVSGSAIRSVEFTGSGSHYARFDDFVFTLVPTPLDDPTKPKVKVVGHTARVTMQDYGDGASYQITATHPKKPVKTKVVTSSNRKKTIKHLRLGKWQLTYSVTVDSQTTSESPTKSIVIK